MPEITLFAFTAELDGTLTLLVIGSAPPSGETVRYQLFDAETFELVEDSGWVMWGAGGYPFMLIDPHTCYAFRYAFFSEGDVPFDFSQARFLNDFQVTESRLIAGMMQLHTQLRSDRGGRIEQGVEEYYSEFDRRGGGV